MSRYYELVMERRAIAEEDSPEGAAMGARLAAEEAAHEADQLKRELDWAAKYPVEWAAWRRVQPLWNSSFGFAELLDEIGPAPAGHSRIERIDDLLPFQRGNTKWVAAAPPDSRPRRPAENAATEYLTLQGVAALTGYSYDFVYDAVRSSALPATRKGRTWRVKVADARVWMERDRGREPLPSRTELRDKVNRFFPARTS